MKVLSFSIAEKIRIGMEVERGLFDLTKVWPLYRAEQKEKLPSNFSSLQDMIEKGLFSLDTFRRVLSFIEEHSLDKDSLVKEEIKYEVPLKRPSKILALGRNYQAHAQESGYSVPNEPIIFDKVITSLLPHQGDILFPRWLSRIDHEVELAVVIGKKGKNIPQESAMEYVLGYTIVNDITARDMQEEDLKQGKPWLRSKGFDTFTPLGPHIVPREVIANPHSLEIILKVNGEERQHSNTSRMVFKIPQLISYISSHMTLLPADVISTGTPEGISPLAVGDRVEAFVEKIGTLKNRVVKEE